MVRCGLCGFLIIKLQTALHHAVWCGAVQYYLWCSEVMPFYGRFWCGFCGLYGLCSLVNTPSLVVFLMGFGGWHSGGYCGCGGGC